ncbi:MAG: RNA methyltransferase, partial [Deltaproteobacteria bacterium]|nr:RNA methyltransferase [Deltaproteobacteria bacterium]
LVLSSGEGLSFNARIESAALRGVTVTVMNERPRRDAARTPVLAQALVKGEKLEWIIQKTVELGLTHIIPFSSARTVPHYRGKDIEAKRKRWQTIALEAATQSGLPFRPTIEAPLSWSELVERFASFSPVILFWEGEEHVSLKKLLARTKHAATAPLLIIGPEGGFAPQEIEEALQRGATTVSLGTQILRVETAAVVATGIVLYERDNLELPLATS